MAVTFSAQVAGFRDLSLKSMRYVATQAIQDVLEAAQTPQLAISKGATSFEVGKMPVDSSALINSLSVDGASGRYAYVAAIAGMTIGDFIRFIWSAEYGPRIEFGFTGTDSLGRIYNQQGRHMIGANAKRFQAFVTARVAEVQK